MKTESDCSNHYCSATVDGTIGRLLTEDESDAILDAFALDTVIGDRYELQSVLGEGGMGKVFLARDQRLERLVAIKVVSHKLIDRQKFYETMLKREAKLGANLNHPGIAVVYDFGDHAGRSFTVFEYVDGDNLRKALKQHGPPGLERTREIVSSLARALDFAHGNGIIHRDLKPENICQLENGECKILDFGLAFETSDRDGESAFVGTPSYASPEQAKGQASGARSDQYALACVAFELICGRRVFKCEDAPGYLRAHSGLPPAKVSLFVPDIPEDVEKAISRALSKDPADRFDSCQEFAEAMGCEPEKKLVRRLQEEQIHFFIAHVSDDSIFSRRLSNQLQELGYRCWYYQRDALPGLSLLSQTNEAIKASAACILIISRTSMESRDFVRELQQAHRDGCALIPVLLDMSLQEFESLQPAWKSILGPIAKIETDRQGAGRLARNIHAAAPGVLEPDQEEVKTEPLVSSRVAGQIWATDAYQIDINELPKVVFENELIKEFLQNKNKHFVSATKGLGKTLLLTYKRKLLTTERQENGSPVTMVPSGRPFLDFMGDLRQLSSKFEAPLADLTTSKRIWSLALRISAISHQDDAIAEDEMFELEPFSKRLQRAMLGNRMEPTLVFKELTRVTVSELNRLIDETEGFLDQKLRQLHQPIMFFIDKVDQAIRNLGTKAWISVQAGLIEAAWDLMNANPHIKIFASIRHEAFTNYESDLKSNLRGAVTVLKYSDGELGQILDRLSQCYEGASSFKDFIGLNVVHSGRRPFLEDSFQMLRRYTFGRPRDLVLIAAELSASRNELNEKKFDAIVRETSASGLVSSIFDESRVFMDSLKDRESRLCFLATIPSNIIDKDQALQLTADYNNLPVDAVQQLSGDGGLFQPLLDLYMAGLLGVVSQSADDTNIIQRFRQPDDLIVNLRFRLPDSDFYLLHPALDRLIEQSDIGEDYYVFRQIRVGHNLTWRPYYELICQTESCLSNVKNGQFVDTTHQFLHKYQLIAKGDGVETNFDALFTSAEWKWLNQHAAEDANKEVLVWLNELLDLGQEL